MANQTIYEQYNPWWQGQPIPARFRFKTKRQLFSQLLFELNKEEVSLVVGLRRVGKSVLLYQIIEHLLKQKVSPERIFYLKCDDPVLEIEKNIIQDAVEFYENTAVQEDLLRTKNKVFFFLDEVQKVEKWGEYLKRYYDLGYNIKFFVTGSSSIQMIKTSKESLAGRAKEHILPTLCFSELVNWRKENDFVKIRPVELFKFKEWQAKGKMLEQKTRLRKREFSLLLNEYFSKGGFPNLYFQKENAYNYIKNEVVDRVIKRDIPEVTGIRNSVLLQRLLILIAKESGNIFSAREISRKLGINFETVSAYLFYLEESFLINILRKYSKGGYSTAKSQPKIHISDIGVLAAASGFREQAWLDSELAGRTVEGLVVNHLKAAFPEANIFFWRDKRGEVDIILEQGKNKLPIEVKYQTTALKAKLTSLDYFEQKYQTNFSLVINQNDFQITGKRIFIPLWMLLLLI